MPDSELKIFVPTKGRAGVKGTLAVLAEAGLRAIMVVEPQEKSAYLSAHPEHGLLVLPKNDQGLVYSRNHVLAAARGQGLGWFWMLDDDIKGFHENYENKNHKVDARVALEGALELFAQQLTVGQAALEYSQLAWSATKPFKLNGYCDVAVCIHTQRTKALAYDEHVTMKEDRDFTLQVLSKGMLTCRVQRFSFAAPKNGSNKGGLYDAYKAGRETEASARMVKKWGKDICQAHTKKDGRPDVKINWAFFQPWKKQAR